jgi:hypothetical protein
MTRIALLAVALLAVTAVADDKKPAFDEKAVMEAMEKQAKVGPEHKHLAALAGDWTYVAKFRMAPEAPPMEMKGAAKRTPIFGGRFLRDDVSGPAQGGMPAFEGLGITGYDNHEKKYVGTWIDSMSTSVTQMTGEGSADGKVLTMHSEQYDPTYGKVVKMRWVTRITGPDSNISEFYTTLPGGKEMKTGEIIYTRKK